MKLSTEELQRLAHLARIALSDEDTATLGGQMQGIFGLIDRLQAVDTTGVAPLAHPLDVVLPLSQRLREDRVTESDNREANLANAPAREDGLFLVPKVIE